MIRNKNLQKINESELIKTESFFIILKICTVSFSKRPTIR